MKILHVYKTFFNGGYGGIEQTISQIASIKNPSFLHKVLSLTTDAEVHLNPVIETMGIEHIRYKENFSIASNSISFSLMQDFSKIVRAFDMVHYHFPWPFADMLHLLAGIKKPTVLTYHSDIVRQKTLLRLYRPIMHRFLKAMDCIIATSPNYLATSPILQKYRNKVEIIPIGLHPQNYPSFTELQSAYWQKRFGKRFFLFVGSLRYYKGLHILLSALESIDLPVIIVGEDMLNEQLKAQAKKLQLNNLHFLGKIPEADKMALLNLCLALLFPSHLRAEAFGVSLLEGAMVGKPLISSEIGTGTSYINIDGETGLVVPPNDPDALKKAMLYIWENDKEAARMGQKAKARYEALFTGEQMVAAYEQVYKNTMQKSKKEPYLEYV